MIIAIVYWLWWLVGGFDWIDDSYFCCNYEIQCSKAKYLLLNVDFTNFDTWTYSMQQSVYSDLLRDEYSNFQFYKDLEYFLYCYKETEDPYEFFNLLEKMRE